ncbi:hypothetical protein PEC301879_19000 [Pectobacterium carotovorum subsp. carotovorum]|nr:hypothetical protein PEC301879_19000 [Pectobacterium carotovorum subsp. carotovorum]
MEIMGSSAAVSPSSVDTEKVTPVQTQIIETSSTITRTYEDKHCLSR